MLRDYPMLDRYRFITLNLPQNIHYEKTSRGIYRLFKKILHYIFKTKCLTHGYICPEYSDQLKFHCHGMIRVTPGMDKKLDMEIKKVRKKYSNYAVKLVRVKSVSDFNKINTYNMKDIPYMNCNEEIERSFGQYTFKDTLNYKPHLFRVRKHSNLPIPHKTYKVYGEIQELENII